VSKHSTAVTHHGDGIQIHTAYPEADPFPKCAQRINTKKKVYLQETNLNEPNGNQLRGLAQAEKETHEIG